MNESIFGLYGSAGCGRDAMRLAREQLNKLGISPSRLFFIDDMPKADIVNLQPVLTYNQFLTIPAKERFVAVAIADPTVRWQLIEKMRVDGIKPWTIVASNVIYLDDVVLGEGAMLSPFVTMAANCRVGKQFHANIYSYVGHDCVVGDYVTFAPRVSVNGYVIIEDFAYLGTGAIIRQSTPEKPIVIGRGAVVGMGAVVTKDVPPGVTVVGNPARPLVKS